MSSLISFFSWKLIVYCDTSVVILLCSIAFYLLNVFTLNVVIVANYLCLYFLVAFWQVFHEHGMVWYCCVNISVQSSYVLLDFFKQYFLFIVVLMKLIRLHCSLLC